MIFDNLHMMHGIISGILISPDVARGRNGTAIALALDQFQDGAHDTMALEHLEVMGEMMGGVERMGGAVPSGVP